MENSSNSSPPIRTSPDLTPWHWGWAASIAVITLITLAFRYALPVRDGDLWFHMLYGKYFLENKTLIADHTIFSWTPTTNDTIYCTWLPDIFFYLVHKVAGLSGIFAFRYLCILVLVLACFLYARKLKIVAHPLVWFICLLGVIMSYTAAFEKPEILSFVFMTFLAWNWWHLRSSGESGWKNCYLFPVIMLVWVNTHGGFVFGTVFLVLIGLGELLNTWLSPQNMLPAKIRKHLAIALILAAITPLLTPYGYQYPLQLFFDLLPNPDNESYNSKIAAYSAPFYFEDTYNLVISADLVIILLLVLFFYNFKKIEWSSLLANLVFAFLYTRFLRTTFYWVPIFLFSSLHLLTLGPVIVRVKGVGVLIYRLLPGILVIAGYWIAGDTLYKAYAQPEKYLWMGFGISDANPVEEARYIKKYFPDSRIGNTYDQGAYLLWELWPENKVFFDARHFPYRSWSDDFFAFMAGKNVREMTRKYPCDLWCVSMAKFPLAVALLDSGEWKLAFYGRNATVLLRKDIPLPQNAPNVSPKFTKPKNLASAIDCLKFFCSIKDWQKAESILNAMNATFILPSQRQSMRWVASLFHGMKAYYASNYLEALRHLEQLQNPPTVIRFMLTSCHHYLSDVAWKKGDNAAALAHARKAWDLVPENIYSLFNLGAIIWQQGQLAANKDVDATATNTNVERPDWRHFMVEFLRTAPHEHEFIPFRDTAEFMLAGKQYSRPGLLVPSGLPPVPLVPW